MEHRSHPRRGLQQDRPLRRGYAGQNGTSAACRGMRSENETVEIERQKGKEEGI